MRPIILSCIALALVFSLSLCEAQAQYIDHECVIFIEPGDSYMGLFGPDWMRVFQANSSMSFYNKDGELSHSPEKLVVGTRLVVPEGTYLTKRAAERLNRYDKIKENALEAISQAKVLADQADLSKSEIFEQGLGLLAGAEKAIQGLTYGFANYVEAGKLACEAIRCFRVGLNLQGAKQDMEQLKQHVKKERLEVRAQTRKLRQNYLLYAGLVTAPFICLLWYARQRHKRERIARMQVWFEQQQDRLDSLEETMM